MVAFAGALSIFLFSYFLGQRYRGPERPLQAGTLIQAATPMDLQKLLTGAGHSLSQTWYLLYLAPLDEAAVRRLSRSYNRLAEDPRLQQRFRLLIKARGAHSLPEFAVEFSDPEAEVSRWCRQLDPMGVCQGLYLIDPEGRLRAIFSTSADPSSIAADFKTVIEHEQP
jgi:hypothetical protein